jgi:hypothetical protein
MAGFRYLAFRSLLREKKLLHSHFSIINLIGKITNKIKVFKWFKLIYYTPGSLLQAHCVIWTSQTFFLGEILFFSGDSALLSHL